MAALERVDFEQRQIGQPLRLGVEDSSNEDNLPRNGIDTGVVQVEGFCRCFSLDEILIATNNFDDGYVIGIGGFAKVYHGFIDNGGATATVVAIKRLKAETNQDAGEFWMEIKILSKLPHTHLVSLIGYCNESQEMILVYEYIALLCGRPAVDKKLDEEKISLVRWARQLIKKGRLDSLIDPSLSGQISLRCLKSFVVLANNCLHESPKSRPTMAEVLHRLELALVSQQRGRTEGIITKAFQGMMDQQFRVRRGISSSTGQSKISPRELDSNSIPQSYRHFSLAEIRVATNDFNKRLLIPNSHEWYIGAVDIDGEARTVVIKRIKKVEGAGAESHAKTLPLHPHLVSLMGFSREGNELILVYDYTANGSL
ncbi:hypothetical protein Vadar_006084 [Vaccinium darrowii]|uniref:Uncharacterized protein n=1 Tax=Vaccinium darrowii TaxID=229202 RepID=A0ACB7YTU5_9ERIC|nr:hypothetical protein Vadar_006084 [Vaccinium darrowii]